MNIEDDDDDPPIDVDAGQADLTEAITRRIESGEPVTGGDLGQDLDQIGTIRQLLPTLRTMIAVGDELIREEGSRTHLRKMIRRGSFLDTTPDVEEIGS